MSSRGCFFDVNIGWPGKVHDARVLVNSSFYCKASRGQLLPDSKTLNGIDIPLLILGDLAYPLLPWLMKAYPESGASTPQWHHFNYHLSQVKMVMENSFGRLKGRWRCLLKRLDYCKVEHIISVVASCVVLQTVNCMEIHVTLNGSKMSLHHPTWQHSPPTHTLLPGTALPKIFVML